MELDNVTHVLHVTRPMQRCSEKTTVNCHLILSSLLGVTREETADQYDWWILLQYIAII